MLVERVQFPFLRAAGRCMTADGEQEQLPGSGPSGMHAGDEDDSSLNDSDGV